MSEDNQPAKTKPKRRSFIKPGELIAGVVFVAVCAVLIVTLVNKLALRHDVTSAKTVADKTIVDIKRTNGAGAYALGSPKFKKTISASALTGQFKTIAVTTGKAPTLDRQIVVDGSSGRTVYFVYKYTTLKVPFYIRVGVQHQSTHWYLVAVTGNVDESTLVGD
ncbi:MAG TPA: hypothetical protein VGM08_04720 [Candidatus Saccharimonadales bacterium]|jgi:hypothetical protein